MHVHNTFPLLSPAIYRAATRRGIPVVQTVQNYRMICAAYMCLRDGHLCHDCVGRALPLPAIRYRCYHESAAQSAVVGAMQVAHRNLGTWDHHCALFLPCSAHVGRRLVAAGAIRDDRWMPRFNHVWPDPGLRADGSDEGYVAFAGRLSEEKGVDVLVRAAAGAPEVDVRIAGDGPVLDEMKRLAGAVGATNVTFLGRLARPDVLPFLRGARCLAFPSIWEEPQGLVIAEAAALGVATIGSDIGGVPEVIGPGMLVPAADEVAWASALRDAAADAEGWRRRGLDSRRVFERDFNAERAYDVLLEAYARIGVRP
jgi:glycosyltransferase involved in cell wall biosynthesis